MNIVLITYDLNKPKQDYDILYKTIRGYPGYARLMDSAWAVSGRGLSAQSVSDTLRAVTDDSTHLFCVDITGRDRQGWLPETSWQWFRDAV